MSESIIEHSATEQLEISARQSSNLPINDLVITKVIEVANEIPADVTQITPNFADYLAGRFLIGINLCGELSAYAIGHSLKMNSEKKREYSVAYNVRAREAGCKTAKDKEQFAFSDSLYVDADNNFNMAAMFKKMVDEKKDLLEKAHYHMRRLAEKDPEAGYKESTFVSPPKIEEEWKEPWN